MTTKEYSSITERLRKHNGAVKALNTANKVLAYIFYVAYVLLIAYLAVTADARIIYVIIVPAVSFILVSLLRSKINAARPYEVLEIKPLIEKDTKGNSFPSRHVFCSFMIASTFFWLWPAAGIALMIVGAAVAFIRVVGGVHFPRDVMAGAALGVLCGIIGYRILFPWDFPFVF